VQVTENVELPVTAVDVNEVPAVEGNVSVEPPTVQDAVIVICTVKLPVAVPACAAVCGNSEAATSAAISIREVVNIFQLPVFGVKTVPASPLALPSEQLSQTIESIAWLDLNPRNGGWYDAFPSRSFLSWTSPCPLSWWCHISNERPTVG